MAYAFEEGPEELEPQTSGSRRGGPPNRGVAVDLLDQPDRPLPIKKIAAIAGLLVLLAVAISLIRFVWPH